MERKSLSNSLKDHSISSKTGDNNNSSSNVNLQNNNNSKLKYSWNYNNQNNSAEDYLGGFSWPPRSYSCRFCKREFRSAQALGGHMNVHRRDRARLRQSPPRDGQCPPILNLNVNPNSNPNPTLSPLFTCTLPSSTTPPPPPSSPTTTTTISALCSPSFASSQIKKWVIDGNQFHDPLSPKKSDFTGKSFFGGQQLDGFVKEDGCKFFKKSEIVRLDLEIGLVRDSKEDLDLELRLGNSS